MTVADILRNKGSRIVTTSPDTTVLDAVKILVSNGIGALLVLDEEAVIKGIISERDILRDAVERHDRMPETRVSEVMTTDLIIGVPEDTVDYVMKVMTERRFRHLPILSEGKLTGIVSIGDVVKAQAMGKELELRHLTDYIMGKYPA